MLSRQNLHFVPPRLYCRSVFVLLINLRRKGRIMKRRASDTLPIFAVGMLFWLILPVDAGAQLSTSDSLKQVKNGSLQIDPGRTIGETFDRFFTHPDWNCFKGKDSSNVVEFTGGFSFNGRDSEALIQFTVTDDGFKLSYSEINGVAVSPLLMGVFIQRIYEEASSHDGDYSRNAEASRKNETISDPYEYQKIIEPFAAERFGRIMFKPCYEALAPGSLNVSLAESYLKRNSKMFENLYGAELVGPLTRLQKEHDNLTGAVYRFEFAVADCIVLAKRGLDGANISEYSKSWTAISRAWRAVNRAYIEVHNGLIPLTPTKDERKKDSAEAEKKPSKKAAAPLPAETDGGPASTTTPTNGSEVDFFDKPISTAADNPKPQTIQRRFIRII